MSASPISQPAASAAARTPAARLAPMPRSAWAVATTRQPRAASSTASSSRSGRNTATRASAAPASASAAASATMRPSGRCAVSLSLPKRRLSPPASKMAQSIEILRNLRLSGQRGGQLLQATQVVHGTEVIDVRQQGANAGGAGLKTLVAQQRIEPDQAAGLTAQAADFPLDAGAVVPVQPVRHQQYHRTLGEQTAGVATVELAQRLADASAAGPVADLGADAGQRRIRVAGA